MSELIQKNDNRATIRWKLLTGASALALAAYTSSTAVVKAEDTSHPIVWIELDGQFSQQKTDEDVFSPAFLLASPFDPGPQLRLQKGPPTIWDKGAKISFQPSGSDWIFSAGIHVGRNGRRETRTQITPIPSSYYGVYNAYQYLKTQSSESHTVLDFQAGKDVGLGKFGTGGKSVFSLGVRYAQFKSSSNAGVVSRPVNAISYYPFDKFYASFAAQRKFAGIGPSLSWDASAMIAGNPHDGGISLDWGLNGAILFGRQSVTGQGQVSDYYFTYRYGRAKNGAVYQRNEPISRSKRVTVPNLGGFAGISWRYAAAKVSMGYRADYFFGVLDGGIDTAKKEDRAFYGPFVSIAVGIGD